MRPKTPHHGARRVRITSAIEIADGGRDALTVEPNVYLAEDAHDKVLLLPSDGEGQPIAALPCLQFEGLLRLRKVVYLSW